jgi:hypothetical protein
MNKKKNGSHSITISSLKETIACTNVYYVQLHVIKKIRHALYDFLIAHRKLQCEEISGYWRRHHFPYNVFCADCTSTT